MCPLGPSGDLSISERFVLDKLEAERVRNSDYAIRLDEDRAEHITAI